MHVAQILALMKLEWKQQLRSGLVWLILAVAILYANPFSIGSPNLWESLSRTVNGPSMLVLSLLLGLLGILSAQRERRQNVAVLVDSTIISSHNLFVGQWLGLAFTTLNLLIILHVLVTAVMLAMGVRLSVIALFRSLVVICFPWALFMVTTGFTLGSFTPIFISIPTVGGIWYVTSALAFFGRLREWLPAPWAALVDPSTVSTASASISFGFLPVERIFTNRIFYLGLSLLIISLGALFYKKWRENRFGRGVVGLSLLGCAIVLIAIIIGWGHNKQPSLRGRCAAGCHTQRFKQESGPS